MTPCRFFFCETVEGGYLAGNLSEAEAILLKLGDVPSVYVDQAGPPSENELFVSLVTSEPWAFLTSIPISSSRSELKTIFVPSGDQSGSTS